MSASTSTSWATEMRAEANAKPVGSPQRYDGATRTRAPRTDENALRAFKLTNEAFVHSGAGRYESWRPFQLGFLLAALPSLVDPTSAERRVVDTLWFATGGGKTETYLGVVVFTVSLRPHARQGPRHLLLESFSARGCSRCSKRNVSPMRSPAPNSPAAVPASRASRSRSASSSAANGTPNRIRDDAGAERRQRHRPRHAPPKQSAPALSVLPRPEPRDALRPPALALAPLLHQPRLPMAGGRTCPSMSSTRRSIGSLPSVIVGTLDKAASVAMQAAMRGLYAAPLGTCKGHRHGFTYAPRSKTAGCLVPECKHATRPLPQAKELFAPTVRIQDELHLLRGGLGAIDAHYETLLDHLQQATGSPVPKNIASSATLAGYEGQVAALYHRDGTVFPLPGPAEGVSFWTNDQPLTRAPLRRPRAARRHARVRQRPTGRVAAASRPPPATIDPAGTCAELNVDPSLAEFLIDTYGTHVVYGNTVRDVEAAVRSFETQPGVTPLNVAKLTGGTLLEEVSEVLKRLDSPESNFEERLHIICASSMMSHGVDIDRFNVITILGVPLTTAEFIQTTARIGRRYPGLVLVLHRMGVERDASVFRTFDIFVRQGDRFIEPIAITRKSRRVLRHTFPGMFLARVLGIHEPSAVNSGGKQLTTVKELRRYLQDRPVTEDDEFVGALRRARTRPDRPGRPARRGAAPPTARNLARTQRPRNQGPLAQRGNTPRGNAVPARSRTTGADPNRRIQQPRTARPMKATRGLSQALLQLPPRPDRRPRGRRLAGRQLGRRQIRRSRRRRRPP